MYAPKGFELTEIPSSEGPQTYVVDSAVTGTDTNGFRDCLQHHLVASFQIKVLTCAYRVKDGYGIGMYNNRALMEST